MFLRLSPLSSRRYCSNCCFYFINPYGRGLKPLDVEVLKQLSDKVNIVPVIAKSDCLSQGEVTELKKKILAEIAEHGIKIYQLPECDRCVKPGLYTCIIASIIINIALSKFSDEDEDFKQQVQDLRSSVPFAVVGASTMVEVNGKKIRGRQYPWGVVEVENPKHCDFVKIRSMLITHMQDLQEVTNDVHYENYRSQHLAKQTGSGGGDAAAPVSAAAGAAVTDKDKALMEKEAELRRMQAMVAQMQQQIKQQSATSLGSLVATEQ